MKNSVLRRVFSALFVFCLLSIFNPLLRAQDSGTLSIMPLPAHTSPGDGQLLIHGSFSVALEGIADARIKLAEERFMDKLSRETGILFLPSSAASQPALTIRTGGQSDAVQKLGEDESYRLEVTSSHALLTAPNPLGALHGLQTFLQLVHITPQGFAAPAVTIDDQPRFPWRGLMIDSGRHFIPIPVIERNLDGMETVKLNVFHWHLSDDQGFRVESKEFPRLVEKGSNGQYYTQEQIRHVIEYARDRGIRVVPEFDMPCHTSSWMAGYPELSSGPGPHQIATRWGVLDEAMDPTRESTYEFLDKFIGEMTALFPDEYFHIGGDECNGKEWDANPRIQAYMREHKLKDNAALQSHFTRRVQKIVAAHGKIMMGWDEVLQPDTPRDVLIHSWRGQTALAAAARQGNRGILSNGYYIDLNQTASQHYLVDPMSGDAASLTPEEKARILGGEATMWSEYVTGENVDSRIWPRTAAIAERLWSPQDVRDVDSMYARLAVVSQKLEFDGLAHQSFTRLMLQRMSGEFDPEALKVLAGVMQPPLGYQREQMRDYDTSSPLNHLVDAVPPESDTAREFSQLAGLIAAGKASAQQMQQARAWLTLWRDNDTKLEPALKQSELTAELASVSQTLSQVSSIGLAALDAIENHQTVSAGAAQSNMAILKSAEKPDAVLRDMVVPAVEVLEEAAGPK
ncbi:MAG TPA: family 20 glycosylhydrolase [Terracidiphilus sp.]|nr:family 20 glycosylhydrolase [Terracidiphilus sp.]